MVKKILILFIITICLLLIFCNDNPSKSQKNQEKECLKYGENVLLPGDLGSQWYYKMWNHGIDYGDTSIYLKILVFSHHFQIISDYFF